MGPSVGLVQGVTKGEPALKLLPPDAIRLRSVEENGRGGGNIPAEVRCVPHGYPRSLRSGLSERDADRSPGNTERVMNTTAASREDLATREGR